MIQLIYIDLFCGGGGTTTGVHRARHEGEPCAIVAACINHDHNAIRSHKSNHKQTLHFTEDITLLYTAGRMTRLIRHVEWLRTQHPDAEVVLWASLECTNFSKAKGGLPRDADSRTLAHHLFPYIESIRPDRIQIENVEEFMSWGELDEHGKPVSKLSGVEYVKWIEKVKTFGYHFQYRIMNAADFGALTSRKRYFGQFARTGSTIYWPEQTHAENPENSLFGKPLKKWRAVKEVLDFSDVGESIFDRKKPLVDATLERIYAGLVKFVAGGKKEFLMRYNTVKPIRTVTSVDRPCGVVTTNNRFGLCNVSFLAKYYSGQPDSKVQSVDRPAPTITTKDHTSFVSAYYGNGDNVSSIDRPAPTVTTKDRLTLVTSRFIMSQYTGGGQTSDLRRPCPAITTNPKQNLITPWVMNTNFNNVVASVEEPAQTITANRKWHYLMNATTQGRFPSFIRHEQGGLVFEVYESDSDVMIRIKEFMAMYGIIDIMMRMLRIHELKKIMGFPEDYVLMGTQAEQKKYIGNAVEVHMATALVEATAKGLIQQKQAASG